MAVPTISSVSPSIGHSGGETLITIEGTGFALPPAPPATGPAGAAPPPSVTVTIGGKPAAAVAVVSSELIYCLTAKGSLDSDEKLITTVQALAVQNNNASGAPISGEIAVLSAAFSYQQPVLTEEGHLAFVLRTLMREIKLQIINNVAFSTHTDFDSDTGDLLNTAMVASLPALIVGNLSIPEDRIYAVNENQDIEIPGGLFITKRKPVVVDLEMTLVGVTDNPITNLNLMQVVRSFFTKNPYLIVNRDETDPTQGSVKYDLEWSFGGPVAVAHQADNSNVESFGGTICVKGILLESMPGISRTKPAIIPGNMPHEDTIGIGGVSADDESAVVIQGPQKR